MKKNIFSKCLVALALVAFIPVFNSCSNTDNGDFLGGVVISGPGVSNHELTIEMESTATLSFTEDFTHNKKVTWTSEDESIVKVDQNGVVTPVAAGTTIVKAYTIGDPVEQGDYVIVTVIGKSMQIVDDALNQSLAE